ncbi:MAG: ferredoxin family protein [Desulfovibrionaceae bacterium]|nr:MAG: ferredoxin family protein [Desulfovibrionaceae bacterium]
MGIRHIDYDKCTRCGRCVTYCPQDVLRPDGERRPVITYLQDCQSCFLCEKYCPAGAIAVSADRERRPILPWKI